MHSALVNRTLDLAVSIQKIPAPTFAEQERAVFIQKQFSLAGLEDVCIDSIGNVYARLPGKGSALPLVISAHMDTVFLAGTNLSIRRTSEKIFGPGIGDNSLGVAGLSGLLWALQEKWGGQLPNLPGDLWLVANVCEEGLGDLAGMRAVVDRFGEQVSAYLILEGMALGQIYHRGLGVQRYRIEAQTTGGHSWVDFGRPSAIHALAELITRITALDLPEDPRTTLNVGVISGGTTVNTIAAQAQIELDLRSEGVQELSRLVQQVDTCVKLANRPDVVVTSRLIGQRPAGELAQSHPLVKLARNALKQVGIDAYLGVGSTDANIPLSLGYPAICLGLTHGGGAHTVDEYILTQPVERGLQQLLNVVEGVFI
jgi:acetylornithine deacetylase/succinyl-diaminopimelate desuccinylase-like protein